MYYSYQKKKAAIIIIHNNKNIKLLVKVLETEVLYVDMSATSSYLNSLFS